MHMKSIVRVHMAQYSVP